MEDRTYVQRIIGDHSFIRLFVSFCSMIEISLLNPPSFLLSTLHQHTIRSYRVLSATLIMKYSSHSPSHPHTILQSWYHSCTLLLSIFPLSEEYRTDPNYRNVLRLSIGFGFIYFGNPSLLFHNLQV